MDKKIEKIMSRCKIALNVEINGKKFKVVDPRDPCSSVNKVLARHEGARIITPQEHERLRKSGQ